ncbi:DNA-3-methyladenine glycosylase I [Amphibacillus indicireducens]|uniref:DNA-3-methyladenine glycosylase I n=2 Tax=Amphibacillus indicireducens TaxID=1076330 RepID=A0ABP7V3I0_9BACI
MMKRCDWVTSEQLYIDYHDQEWGRPSRDDRHLFEMLCLEGAQAGLSWWTILQKRANYRRAFDQFDPWKIVTYDQQKIDRLLEDPGIVRNRLKIKSVISNAEAYLRIIESGQRFANYIWQFVDGEPIINHWHSGLDVPASTGISEQMSRQLKKDGFKFVGPTICYAYMQAVGMVNDHLVDCFCHPEITN